MSSKFQVKKPEPKTADIERFAKAADSHATELSKSGSEQKNQLGRPSDRGDNEEKLTVNFTVRLSESEDSLLSYVFENSKEKSKQKLVRKILLERLEAMRRELD